MDQLNMLLHEQLKGQLNLHVAAMGDRFGWMTNNNLFRTWLKAKERKVI